MKNILEYLLLFAVLCTGSRDAMLSLTLSCSTSSWSSFCWSVTSTGQWLLVCSGRKHLLTGDNLYNNKILPCSNKFHM